MNGTASGTIPVRALIALLLFGAVSALAGGIGIAGFGVGAEYLARTPFPSLLIPGLILILVVGGTQLAAAVLLIGKREPALLLAAVAGQVRDRAGHLQGAIEATTREMHRLDGVTEEFTKPGGRYPDDSVSWTYDKAGARDVSLTTYWKASFTVDGEGPFAVPGPEITKTAGPLTVPVREARSVLVGG